MTETQDMVHAGQGMDTLIFVVLFLVFGLVRVLGELAKQRANRKERPSTPAPQRGEKGEWEDWKSVFEEMSSGKTAPAKPAPPRPAPIPPVIEVEDGREQREDVAGPASTPMAPPPARPRPVMSAPREGAPTQVEAPALAVAASVVATGLGALGVCPEPATANSPRAMMSASLAAGFPHHIAIPPPPTLGTHRRIRVRLHSRQNLRQGILLSEILGQPRAFDV